MLYRALCGILLSVGALSGSPHHADASIALQVLVTPGGQPDDITTDGKGGIVWGDLARGTVDRFDGKRVTVLARGISVPEGVVVLPGGDIIVAEQGKDRIDRIDARGRLSVVRNLVPVAGQEGVDGIGRDPRNGDLLIPDSPHGTVFRMNVHGGNVRTIASGIGRPVDAAMGRGGYVLIPDEHLDTLVVVSPRGRVSYRGSLSIPDDVAVSSSGRVWVTTLGDNSLWEVDPGAAPIRQAIDLANPQGLMLDRCGDPIVVEQNAGRIVRLLLTARSARCAL